MGHSLCSRSPSSARTVCCHQNGLYDSSSESKSSSAKLTLDSVFIFLSEVCFSSSKNLWCLLSCTSKTARSKSLRFVPAHLKWKRVPNGAVERMKSPCTMFQRSGSRTQLEHGCPICNTTAVETRLVGRQREESLKQLKQLCLLQMLLLDVRSCYCGCRRWHSINDYLIGFIPYASPVD